MPWSIFSDGGGPGAALTWANDLLQKIGAPLSAGNEQMVYDWEVSEGGGGRYNPLNQGPVPGHQELTTTGQQYGGGAADFASWSAGLTGAADYLQMPSFKGIADALRRNDPVTARADLIASPWAASHYGGGSSFSSNPIPGKASALPTTGGGTADKSSTDAGFLGIPGAINGAVTTFGKDLKTIAFTTALVVAGGALMVWGFARATGAKQKAEHVAGAAGTAAQVGALAA